MSDRIKRFTKRAHNYFKKIAVPTTENRRNLDKYKTAVDNYAKRKPKAVIADMAVSSKNLLTPSLLNQIPPEKIDEKLIRYFDVPNVDTQNEFSYVPKKRLKDIKPISNFDQTIRRDDRDYYKERKSMKKQAPVTKELKKLQKEYRDARKNKIVNHRLRRTV